MSVSHELHQLYQQIQSCHICPNMDKEKALRLVETVNPESDVLIVSQSLAEKQVRQSGVNFFKLNGKLGNTGQKLERFLNQFNRTVLPYKEIEISDGANIPKCEAGYLSVYSTDIASCYPGKKKRGKGDRTPTSEELYNCIKQGFLVREIELIKPKLLLLMGKRSRNSLYKYVLGTSYPELLSTHISEIIQSQKIPQFKLANLSVRVLPIQHASGANPDFDKMVNNDKLLEIIKEVLR